MSRRLMTFCAVLVALTVTLIAAPAQAAAPAAPSASNLDASTPGHLTATVSTPDAAYVWARIVNADVPEASAALSQFALPTGSGQIDVPTWGYSGDTYLQLAACTTANPASGECSTWAQVVNPFTPLDSAPQVEWSTDETVGPGQNITVNVSDPNGGGLLVADAFGTHTQLNRNGTTVVASGDGSGDITIERCAGPSGPCAAFDPAISHHYVVARSAPVGWFPVEPISPSHPNTVIVLRTPATGTYDLQWHLENADKSVVTPTQTETGQPIGPDGSFVPLNIVGADIADGTYSFVATALTIHDPNFGTFNQTLQAPKALPQIRVDRTGPDTPITIAHSTIYPNISDAAYPATTRIQAGYSTDAVRILIRAGNSTVRTMPAHTFDVTWNGRNDSGAVVPSGVYHAMLLDDLGNISTSSATITVSTQHLINKTWRRTITARRSFVDKYVGRCSTLRSPSSHGWAGSLGFEANTKCRTTTWRASAVSTLHGIYVPRATRYLNVRVNAYGGAARSKPGSRAVIRCLTTSGTWKLARILPAGVGSHPSETGYAKYFVNKDRSLFWGVYTYAKQRYDIARFTITLTYQILE